MARRGQELKVFALFLSPQVDKALDKTLLPSAVSLAPPLRSFLGWWLRYDMPITGFGEKLEVIALLTKSRVIATHYHPQDALTTLVGVLRQLRHAPSEIFVSIGEE